MVLIKSFLFVNWVKITDVNLFVMIWVDFFFLLENFCLKLAHSFSIDNFDLYPLISYKI